MVAPRLDGGGQGRLAVGEELRVRVAALGVLDAIDVAAEGRQMGRGLLGVVVEAAKGDFRTARFT